VTEWEDATEPIPGDFVQKPVELGVDLKEVGREWEAWSSGDAISRDRVVQHFWPTAKSGPTELPDMVVFEPNTRGLVTRLHQLGYGIREAKEAVNVMTLVAERPTAAVVIGVSFDGERRRLLTGALKVRFPHVPIIYVTGHAATADGVRGALREGAQAVLAWPLPPVKQIDACLAGYAMPDKGKRAMRDNSNVPATWDSETELGLGPPPDTKPPVHKREFHEKITKKVPVLSLAESSAPKPVDLGPRTEPVDIVETDPTGFEDHIETVAELRQELRDDLPILLRALKPFIWSVRNAATYLEEQAIDGDHRAVDHARSLKTVARILEQLQDRADD
jgi:CheY-like chemotaxis protein